MLSPKFAFCDCTRVDELSARAAPRHCHPSLRGHVIRICVNLILRSGGSVFLAHAFDRFFNYRVGSSHLLDARLAGGSKMVAFSAFEGI